MTTLITQRVGQDAARRCDAKCYGAHGPDCDCICGGINHGKGLQAAIENTRELVGTELAYIQAQGFDLDPSLAALVNPATPQLF